MKIRKLNIGSYRHLENIELDFTYPEGHVKAGEPLEKICFIGQSATGKTGLLELVKELLYQIGTITIVNETGLAKPLNMGFNGDASFYVNGRTLSINNDYVIIDDKMFSKVELEPKRTILLIDDIFRVIYYSSEIIADKVIRIFNKNPIEILNAISEGNNTDNKRADYFFEFTQEVDEDMWFSLLGRVLNYRKKFTQMASELINKGAIGDLNKLNQEYQKWSAANENPLIPFAELFNPILEKLHLEVDLVNTEFSIPIKSKYNGEIVPISKLSTGTKGLLLSFFPLFEYDTENAIILIDEPERSLFPDLQIELFLYYKKFAPKAQFITATHSPFIAAAFEPEERFILYYDENGNVKVTRGTSPIGDDPNDILRKDFQVDYYNEFGKKAYQDYLLLKGEMKVENDPVKKRELLVKLTQLGDKYNFNEEGN